MNDIIEVPVIVDLIPMKEDKVQALIFNKQKFQYKKQVKRWMNRNNYKPLKYMKEPIKSHDGVWKCRIKEARYFEAGTFFQEKIDFDVIAIKGISK